MTKLLRRLTVGALALGVVTACDDGTDPVPTATVQVLAYVDADNSNDYDASVDDAIEGATVTLTMVGAADNALTATTASDGIATFSGVEIGSYTASIALPGSVAGVTLASASAPTVTVEEDATAEGAFRYTYNPGSLSGHAFLGSGAYADGAVVIPGLAVSLQEDGTEVASTETDASGAFAFTGLMPGDYTVELTVPVYLTTASASQGVTVTADEEATADFGFETNVTHTIAQARAAAEGEMVVVSGVAITGTAGEQAALSTSSFYMEDDAGIYVYRGNVASAEFSVAMGEEVLLYGARGSYMGEVQLEAEAMVVLGDGTVPTPVEATVSDVKAGDFQGQLGTIQDLYVTAVEQSSSGTGGDVWVRSTDTFEELLVYVDNDAGIDVSTAFAEGGVYDLTGVVAFYAGTFELKPRMPGDIVEDTGVDLGTTIADVRAATVGTAVTVQGVVTAGSEAPGDLEWNGIYIQDATAGVFVYFGAAPPAGLAIGDLVEVSGERGEYNGTIQIVTPTVTELGVNVEPAVRQTTVAVVDGGAYMSELVEVTDVEVVAINGSSLEVMEEGVDTDTLTVYIDSDSNIEVGTTFGVGGIYHIAGIVTVFNGDYQIKPRMPEDITEIQGVAPTVMTVAEARAADAGAYVEVSGVVTVDSAAFGGTSYIQDETGGISIYYGDGVAEGDQVTVVGTIGAYHDNIQIGGAEITTTGTTAVPDPVTVTGTQLNAGEHPGELATLQSFTVTAVEVTNSYGTQKVTGTAGDGTTVMLYVDNRTGIAEGDWAVGTAYTVTGVIGYYDDAWYLWPRKQADKSTL